MAHQWREKERYGYGHQDVCHMCEVVRFYSWTPGWPGSYEYFGRDGAEIKIDRYEEPPCDDGPLFRHVKKTPPEAA
jgi:hypothetical protein